MSEVTEAPSTDQGTQAPPPTRTRLSRGWLLRVGVIGVAFAAFGTWGLFDALVAYPKRGERYADYMLKEYLEEADRAGRLHAASVPDPVEELRALESKDFTRMSPLELARLEWLKALATPGLGGLAAEKTNIDDPRARLNALQTRFAQGQSPTPLKAYDIPSQWLIVAVGWGVGLYNLVLIGRVGTKTYRWEPDHKRLILPRGETIGPADLEDVDKRKWHKYIVFLKVKPDHPRMGGQDLKLDLFRYAHLEGWVLEMEKEAFPERQQEAEKAAAAGDQGEKPEAEPPAVE